MIGKIALLIFAGLISGCRENSEKRAHQIRQGIQMAQRIKIDELKNELQRLENGQTEFGFIGITSNGKDCIYFIYERGKFYIEFEAMIEIQIPFIDKLKEFSKAYSLETEMTTYNNNPHYKSEKPAPVLRINANTDINRIATIGKNIQYQVFGNNEETVYEVVP